MAIAESHVDLRADPDGETDPTRPRVLLVEDDVEVCSLLAQALSEVGYQVDAVHDGQHGLHSALAGEHAVIIVDRGLPAMEGSELIRQLRKQGVGTPALMLTAWGSIDDRVDGLNAGADDYLIKPFDIKELVARLGALTRRHRELADALPLGRRSLVVLERRVVGQGQDDIHLSRREGDLLELLARHPDQTFTRSELLVRVFGAADTAGAVDTYVHYLRRKLGRDVVTTVRGSGYRMGRA